ncbi:hypothetical protein [Mucilaginibacter sp. L3T2-6]|uniref:hypothetical protein n=1 Tax=Mucilaginibacter sp. L3T2-6 TaxID=3062491 RepID=UPI002675C6CA|nr:hypothetical protein [Mucilaginibacter sp. L3T2-6]MDO3643761.1 hypothetical protein [Mucilaginibacter sp. L3T2-6]MDV6216212.1 hypothetical protein [Mucilaginibacter sp. L3T2-6]
MSFDEIFLIYLVVLLFVIISGLARYRQLNKAFRLLTITILCTLISEGTKKIYGKISHNSMPQAHVWAVIEFALFSLTYYYLINSAAIKRSIIYVIGGMVLLEIANIIFFEKLTQFPSLILEASHIVYVIYALLLFRQMLLSPAEQSLFKQSLFWFNLNMLFYATTMFLNFALLSYFIENKLDAVPLVYFSVFVNFIFYIVIGISLLIDNRKTKISVLNNG